MSLADGKESACKAGDPGSILGWGTFPEKGLATCSSILAWRIPPTEQPGALQFVGSESDVTKPLTFIYLKDCYMKMK